MTPLRKGVEEYLTLRRSLGFELRLPGSMLRNFSAFLERKRAPYITKALALLWAQEPAHAQPCQWANRLGIVRRFAQFYCTIDPRTEVPPLGLLPHRYRRKAPHIYSLSEVRRLINATKKLASPSGLRSSTYATLLGLLAVTGMRISEALDLNRADIDWSLAVLSIRRTKFGKSRLIPLHASSLSALKKYSRQRERIYSRPSSDSFFVSERGTRLQQCAARWNFVMLSKQIGLRGPSRSHGHGPRLHDFRHRLAVSTLIDWYRAGVDVEQKLPVLATYLGHTHWSDTYWYLSSVPELLCLAAARLERGGLS